MSDGSQDVTEAAIRRAIRARRAAVDVTWADVSEATGISRYTLNRYVHGDSKLYFGTLVELAKALDTTVVAIVEDAMELTRQGLVPEEEPDPTAAD